MAAPGSSSLILLAISSGWERAQRLLTHERVAAVAPGRHRQHRGCRSRTIRATRAPSPRNTRADTNAGQADREHEKPGSRQSRALRRRRRPDHRPRSSRALIGFPQGGADEPLACFADIRGNATTSSEGRSPPWFSPPAGRAAPAACMPSSRSAWRPCFSYGAGTRTRRGGPVRRPALMPREVSRPKSPRTCSSPFAGISLSSTLRSSTAVDAQPSRQHGYAADAGARAAHAPAFRDCRSRA
jgi:hypothetical protein